MKTLTSIVIFCCVLLSACSNRQAPGAPVVPNSGHWVDLSHDFAADTIYWPTAESFKLETVAAGNTDAGYYYSAYQFSAAEHGGTHLDAPVHFAEGRESVDQIPLDRLIGPAIKVDASAKAQSDRDYQINVADFEAWEKQNGRIPDESIVLLQTGWSGYWNDRVKYLGTDKRGAQAVAELHFPRARARSGPLADRESQDQGDRAGHGEHRLRSVQAVREPPHSDGTKHSGFRERC